MTKNEALALYNKIIENENRKRVLEKRITKLEKLLENDGRKEKPLVERFKKIYAH